VSSAPASGEPVTLRFAQPADSAALERLERDAWDENSTPEISRSGVVFGVRIPFADTIVAVRGDEIVGYAAIGQRSPFTSNRHIGVLRAIVVARGARRAGIASRLLARAEDEARARGFEALRLTVMATNEQAIALYRRAGYSELGRYPDEFRIRGRMVDDVLMGKRLGSTPEKS